MAWGAGGEVELLNRPSTWRSSIFSPWFLSVVEQNILTLVVHMKVFMVCPGTEFCSVSWSRSSKIPVGVHVEVFRVRDRAQHEVQRRCGADQDPGLSSSLENLDIISSCPLHLAVTRPGVHATVHVGIWENSTHFLREGGARAVRTRKSGYYFNELFIWRSGGGLEQVLTAKCSFFRTPTSWTLSPSGADAGSHPRCQGNAFRGSAN